MRNRKRRQVSTQPQPQMLLEPFLQSRRELGFARRGCVQHLRLGAGYAGASANGFS